MKNLLKKRRDKEKDAFFPKFIPSAPAGKDMLVGQPQGRIAETISDLIRHNKAANKLIGIEGSWGAGKSNLIELT